MKTPTGIVAAAAQDVEAIKFIAESKSLKEALRSANLLKSLQFNTLISGEVGTGRHTLARYMLPDAKIVSVKDRDISTLFEGSGSIILDEIESAKSYSTLAKAISSSTTKIVAISKDVANIGPLASLFSVKISIPPLRERMEDIPPLANKFADEAKYLFGDKGIEDFKPELNIVDLSKNAFSLRHSIYLQYFASKIKTEELFFLNQVYLEKLMDFEKEDIYRKELKLYEVPLIKAGVKRYKSQLKMSQKFGLNRNTLRKKILEWKEFL